METDTATTTATRWNEKEGVLWATEADRFDAIAAPHIEPITEGLRAGEHVLDVGCGAGATTVAAATIVGPDGRVVGVDLSAPLLDVARRRAPHLELLEADATAVQLPERSFDALIGRSVVQLLPDPTAGLRHVRRALKPGGRLATTVWREAASNGWSSIPSAIVARHLGLPAEQPRTGPGAFALADPDELRAVVERAGFVDVHLEALDHRAVVGADVDDAVAFFDRVSGAALRTIAPPHVGEAIEHDLRVALADHDGPGGVAVPAAAWVVTASNP